MLPRTHSLQSLVHNVRQCQNDSDQHHAKSHTHTDDPTAWLHPWLKLRGSKKPAGAGNAVLWCMGAMAAAATPAIIPPTTTPCNLLLRLLPVLKQRSGHQVW
ncbi:uncharacterized protein Tco025E_08915 [Trypanosoma conorhini]|uniref:Uncharacterized protein n=1 Tax=Trypanosoma conorhini TaxID=83891 RepID=A0A422N2X8_9TRYP|nr:uncharacterized protein Tco025E_08915 [Trypanosoma conorhini]RNE99836.1 hypothetical protein Tco025E_08915 [Trypanosoma conorhini]